MSLTPEIHRGTPNFRHDHVPVPPGGQRGFNRRCKRCRWYSKNRADHESWVPSCTRWAHAHETTPDAWCSEWAKAPHAHG